MTEPRHTCGDPVSWEQHVAYWAHDLDAEAASSVEERVFACAACTATSERVARITEAVRSQLPTVLATEQALVLRRQGLAIIETTLAPATRTQIVFAAATDLMIHHLAGLDLARADRVDLRVLSESSGEVIFEDLFVPFDRDRGEVLIACQRHFAALPNDVVFEVRTHHGAAAPTVTTYMVPHVFEAAPSP